MIGAATRAGALLLGLLGLLACSPKNNGTLLVVEAATDLRATEVDRLDLVAQPTRGQGVTQSFSVAGGNVGPFRMALVPEGDPDLGVVVTITAFRSTQALGAVAASVAFDPGQARLAQVFLNRACFVGPRRTTCQNGEQCVGPGLCVPANQVATVVPYGVDAGLPPRDAGPEVGRDAQPREAGVITGSWTMVADDLVPGGSLNAVYPLPGGPVFAVGARAAEGQAFVYDGTTFVPEPLPPGTRPLFAVWAASADEAWAAGMGGQVLRRTGGQWAAFPTGTTATLTSIWGRAADDVWFVGFERTALHWNGSRLEPDSDGITSDLSAVAGSAAGDLWAVGPGGGIYERVASTWQRHDHGRTQSILYSVWSNGPADVWAVGQGVSLHFDGFDWVATSSGLPTALGVWAAADNDVWAVGLEGQEGVIAHFDGFSWTSLAPTFASSLQSIRGTAANAIWAVGAGGLVLRYQ